MNSYCEAYARNQANEQLSGSAVLGLQPKLAAEERETRRTLAFTDCLALYASKPSIQSAAVETETVTTSPIPTPRTKPKNIIRAQHNTPVAPAAKIEAATAVAPVKKKQRVERAASLVAGSPAWKDYCAAKYASYNPATDTFTSLSGEQRPCRVTKSEPARITATQLPPPPAKSQLPTRAAKSQLPAATSTKSQWDSFDNPKLPISR